MRTLYAALGAFALSIVLSFMDPRLVPLAAFLFLQNVSFTFVSRGRNSGSLAYHLVAAVFSNGLYVVNLLFSIKLLTDPETIGALFVAVYTLATLSGSVFAHWLALRVERGKARNVQEDSVTRLRQRLERLEREANRKRSGGDPAPFPFSTGGSRRD